MPKATEIGLGKSVAPANISDRATIKVLTTSGFKVVYAGHNVFVCKVIRAFSARTFTLAQFCGLVYDLCVRAPSCFNPHAKLCRITNCARSWQWRDKDPAVIAKGIEAAYSRGQLPKRSGISFAYMWSANQNLTPAISACQRHDMIFAPYYDNSMVGENGFNSPLPQVTDDAGTPFAVVVVIPVDDRLAVKAGAK